MININYPYAINSFHLESDKNFSAVIAAISQATGRPASYFDRENFIYGYYPRIVFSDGGEPMHLIGNKVATKNELYNELRANWRPVRQDECDWYANNL